MCKCKMTIDEFFVCWIKLHASVSVSVYIFWLSFDIFLTLVAPNCQGVNRKVFLIYEKK